VAMAMSVAVTPVGAVGIEDVVTIVGVSIEIRTGHLPRTSQTLRPLEPACSGQHVVG
jgi:hypothetical protein